jgi:AcrR family transcriptional regulator
MALHHAGGLIGRAEAALSVNEQILVAALSCFLEKGYAGTSVRDIAARAGISVPGLYHHYPSKIVLLERLMEQTMDDLISQTGGALERARPDPVDRFSAVVTAHVRFHCERSEESFIGNSELRSLSGEVRKNVMEKRDRQQAFFTRVVEEGLEAGTFDVKHPHITAVALASMCTAVATWYHRDGTLSPEDVVSIYRDLALDMVGFRG